MQKLGSLVEEGGIVLIALDNKGARGPQLKTGSQNSPPRRRSETKAPAPAFSLRGDLVNPRQHAGGGGFAVRAGDHQRLAAYKKFFAQQRGHRGEGNALVEHALHFGIAARERIADDDQVRRGDRDWIPRKAPGWGCRAPAADRSSADRRPCRSR